MIIYLKVVGDGHAPMVSYIAMYLGAAKGMLNVLAINEGRLYGVIFTLYPNTKFNINHWKNITHVVLKFDTIQIP